MLKDKGQIVEVTLPALASTETATFPIAKSLGISEANAEDVVGYLLAGTNVALSKVKVSNVGWCFRFTASGTVSANAKAYVHAQLVGQMPKVKISAKDA